MCGICGAVGFEQPLDIVRQMTQAMVHRGPDSDGFLERSQAALGMRRLKIIDLATGDQPIFNEDRQVAIVFNGEIYNFAELCRHLQAGGHRFTTRSDTEAIIHAYEEWGPDCVSHLRGMFAFAIYDEREAGRPRLFIARDRLGIKPLYVWQTASQLMFASEVRALMASGQVPRRLSAAGLYTYLAFGSVQEPLTLVEGVTSLPPGTWLRGEWETGRLTVTAHTYWLPPAPQPQTPSTEEVYGWVQDAVSSHLISDVPLGAFLSGGLDSGTIVAVGSTALHRPMRTFTLGFDHWPNDERTAASETAHRWQTDHQVRVIAEAEVMADLPQAIRSLDQPSIDGINTWFVAREAKRAGLTVALSGVGGDELFAGYPSFRRVPQLKRMAHLPAAWLAHLAEDALVKVSGRGDAARKLGAYLTGDVPFHHPYFAVRGLFTINQVQRLLSANALDELGDAQALSPWRDAVETQVRLAAQYDEVGEVSWLELSQYMRSTLLRDTDAMSMAHSLEVRVPFVDHRLVDHMLPVSGNLKLDDERPKPLLANAMAKLLPSSIAGAKKRTFTFPFEVWLRQGLSRQVAARLNHASGCLESGLDPKTAAHIWHEFEAARTNWARPWALYILVEWVNLNLCVSA